MSIICGLRAKGKHEVWWIEKKERKENGIEGYTERRREEILLGSMIEFGRENTIFNNLKEIRDGNEQIPHESLKYVKKRSV